MIQPYRYAVISAGFPTLAGLWARYKAELQAGADNSAVTSLLDQSGNARNSVSTAANAVKRTGILNGKAIWDFTTNVANYTLPSMAALTGGAGVGSQLHGMGTSGLNPHIPFSDGINIYDDAFQSSRYNFAHSFSFTNYYCYNVQAKSGTNNFIHRLNNVAKRTVTATPLFPTTPFIGRCNVGNNYAGRVAEIVICSTVLNSTERTNINAYFNAEYGLSIP
jgi:hypothetical protein